MQNPVSNVRSVSGPEMVKTWHLCSGVTGHVTLHFSRSAVPRCCQKVAERPCKHSRPGSWWWKWLSLQTGELVRNGKFLERFLKAPCCAAKPLKIVMFCQSICWERELFFQQAIWFNFHFSRRDFKQMFIECLLCRPLEGTKMNEAEPVSALWAHV